jgi:internalin A
MASAKKLIAENKLTRATFLDLGNCGLTEVPAEIGELVWLEGLSFANHWYEWNGSDWQEKRSRNNGDNNMILTELSPLAGLCALRMLAISGTQVSDLAPLAGLSNLQQLVVGTAKVTDLAPLASLAALQILNIAGARVSDLRPLANLSALQTLHLSGTLVTDITPLAGLSALQTLYVAQTQVSDLEPLAGLSNLRTLRVWGTYVKTLAPLADLSKLQKLHVSGTSVTDLAPLANLSAMQEIDAARTNVTDLVPLAGLSALQTLNLSWTNISDLTPLAGLSALQTLYLSRTKVTDLTPLAGLPSLQTLHVSNTRVTDLSTLITLINRGLPVKWDTKPDPSIYASFPISFRDLWEGNGIYVEGCPLTNPPPEIVNQGNNAILNYFGERAKGGINHLYEAKMLILGEGGAGKTSLLRRLYQREKSLPTESETTKGIEIHKHEFNLSNGRRFRLNVWDFGGQQIYHATHQFFLTHRSLYLLVDDTGKDYKSASDEGFKYWLELIDVFSGHSPTLIFQNEKGGRSKAIDFEGIKRRYGNVEKCYAGNLENANAADKVRDGIEFFATHLSHIGEELPARWIKVRADIEELAAKQPYVPVEKYFEIYGRHIEFDETKALLLSRYLHDLGVFLHFQYDLLLKNTVILQNEWATEAVFRILDNETIKKKLGRFNNEDCARLWKDSAYARMHPQLLALMQNFELCYELRDSKPPVWLVPQLLPPEKPAALSDWGKPEDLVLRYKYDFMPKGMISRLTVRLHRFVHDPKLAWATGVLFERDTTAVLVQIIGKGDEIELRARGPETKALLSVIAADLDALNDSFQGLKDKVDKRIPCICKNCLAASDPGFFDQKALLERKEDNQLKVECPRPRSYEKVDVLELLDGMKLDKLPVWANEGKVASAAAAVAPREIRIFLASSFEFADDRDDFELYFRQQNDLLRKKGFYLEIVRWENFLDAVSKTRLQNEYNKAICECDIFLSLFFTRTGKYTKEEFDVAFREFKKKDRPRIFTYFKDAPVNIRSLRQEDFNSLRAFQAELEGLGHFPTFYTSIDDLKLRFRDQLDKVLEQIRK